jgi:hypothetical protein
MNTRDIMRLALDLGGFEQVPADSGIWVEGDNLGRVLVGLDVGPAELLLARQLGFDAVIAHHPVRRAGFWQVFERHRQLMREAGVPDEEIRAALDSRSAALQLSEYNTNDDQVISVARLLGLPFLNVHLPLDEYGRQVLIETVRRCQTGREEASAGDVAAAIGRLPSFQRAGVQPLVAYGSALAPAGRTVVSIAAGTNGGYSVARAYFASGVDTVIYMHLAPEDLERLRQEGPAGALIITGHQPGDAIGLDAFVRALRQRGLEVATFSGVDTPDD